MNGEEYEEFPRLRRPPGIKWPRFPKWVIFFFMLSIVSLAAIFWWGKTDDGPFTDVVLLHDSQSTKALNIVILGDGFTSSSMGAYHTAADQFVNRLKTLAPFSAATETFNVYRVDVISNEVGIDVPANCNAYDYLHPPPLTEQDHLARTPDPDRDTALGTTFCPPGSTMNYYISSEDFPAIWDYANASGVFPDLVIVLINDWMYGAMAWVNAGVPFNSSGGVAFVTIGQRTGEKHPTTNAELFDQDAADAFPDVAIHETGHLGPFRLLDEYGTNRNGVSGADQPIIDGSPNLTRFPTAPIKWESLRTPGSSLPTTCSGSSLPDAAAVEKGGGYAVGVFHARCDCRMNQYASSTFCVVCRRQILDTLAIASPSTSGTSTFRLILDSFRLKTLPDGEYFINFVLNDGGVTNVSGRWPKTNTVLVSTTKTEEPGYRVADLALGALAIAPWANVKYSIFKKDTSGAMVMVEEQTISFAMPSLGRGSIEQFDHATHRVTFGYTRR